MRNKKTKTTILKLNLNKCDEICITYSKLQYAYALILNQQNDITKVRTNVLLEGFKDSEHPDREYTSDFICTKTTGDLMVRECIERKLLERPMTIRLLDESREYWLSHGVSDWGIVIDAE